ncbi:helicase-related protein [Jatrophihabitans fulvus]
MTPADELGALHALRDAGLALLEADADTGRTDAQCAPLRAAALALYRQYVERFGPLNRGELREAADGDAAGVRWRRPDLGGFRRDPAFHAVMALEVHDPETGRAVPAPILERRVHRPVARTGSLTPFEALLAVGVDGRVDLAAVAEAAGLPDAAATREALGDQVLRDPADGAWVAAHRYLTGDLRAKREQAARAAQLEPSYRVTVAALDAAVPPDVGPLDIAVSLGAPWVSAKDIEAFVHEELRGRVTVWHLPSAAHWKIVPKGKVPPSQFSTGRLNAYEILSAGLNGRQPVVFDTVPVPGKRLRIRNAEASLAAHDALVRLQERFRDWLWSDEQRTVRLVREYNRRFNTHVVTRYDGSRLTFPDLAEGLELWPWQRDIVARIVASPATLCAHAVGAGKTRAMIGAAITARRLGVAARPLVAVPAHLLDQTAREARQAFPRGRFLVGDLPRDRLAAQCATGDWDAVIVTHGTLSGLPVDPDVELARHEGHHAELERQTAAGFGGAYGRSVLRRRLAALERTIERVRARPRPAVTFETLGVDLLLVDEAHYFKRLPVVSRMGGIPLGSSRRAADLLLKAQLLRERRGHLPSLALFTGTPWSNTIAETFVWQTYLQPDVLAAAGVEQFDAWAAVFVEHETSVEVGPDSSGIRLVQRPSRIRNVPELRRMLAQSADVLRQDDLGLERPAHTERTVVCEPTPRQRAYVGSLGARVDKIRRERHRGGPLRPGDDNMLAVCGDGRRAALDPMLVGIAEPSSKLAAVADEVAGVHHRLAEVRFPGSDVPGVLQLVLCDQGTPGHDGPQSYGRLRILLDERGVPAERVRWVHSARTPAERAALFAACRDGAVSVLIGSTDTLGVGSNVQARLAALHHVDAPWRPSDIEQREGRILRPGNGNAEVEIVRYVTRGTFDAYMWQALQRKAAFVEQLYRGGAERAVDDIAEVVLTYAEVKALAAGNELLLEHATATAELARLRVLRSLATQTVTAARRRLSEAEQDRHRLVAQERMLRSAQLALAPGGDDAVARAVASLRERWGTVPDDPAPVRAPWRGLGIELLPTGGWRAAAADDPATVDLRMTLAHRRVDVVPVPAGLVRRSSRSALTAVTTRLRRWADRLDERIAEVAAAAADADDRAAAARDEIDTHRFERADELAAAEATVARLAIALEAGAA